ncbi:MAG: hypothetical protein ACOC6J_09195 [Spirochaetota bacterium]
MSEQEAGAPAGEEHLLAMVRSITGSAVEAIARAARADVIGTGSGKDARMRVTRATLSLDDARARELVDRLDALVHELAADVTETREDDDA